MDTAIAQVTNRGATNKYGVDMDNEENNSMVKDLMSVLSDKQREIVKLRFGMGDDGMEHGADAIALMLGYTKNEVDSALTTAMRKMKRLGSKIGMSTGYAVTPSQFNKVTLKKKKVEKEPKRVKVNIVELVGPLFDQLILDIKNGVIETLPTRNGGHTTKLSVSTRSGIKWLAGSGKVDDDSVSKEGVLKICSYYDTNDKLSLAANKFLRRMVSGNTTYYRHVAHYLLSKASELTNNQIMEMQATVNA